MADVGFSSVDIIDISLERSIYVGNFFCGILYGLEIFTFFAAVYCISHRPPDYRKSQKFYVVYGGILLALVTINVAVGSAWGQYMWIDHRNYLGGPLGFYTATQGAWYNVFRFAANATRNLLGDGLLVYRCFIIWNSRWRIIALPALIYLTSFGAPYVTGILSFIQRSGRLIIVTSGVFIAVFSTTAVVESALPGTSLQNGRPIRLATLWVSLSVSLNVIVTSMICFRLLRMRALARDALTPEMSSMYTSVAAMLVESAAPFSILGIGLIVTAAQRVSLVFAFALVWNMFCSLSPQMVILRVAMGRAWLKGTVNEISSALVFAEAATVREQSQGVYTTVSSPEGPISGLGTPADESEASVRKYTGTTGDISC